MISLGPATHISVNWGKFWFIHTVFSFFLVVSSLFIFITTRFRTYDRSNFLGTKFIVFDNQPSHKDNVQPNNNSSRKYHYKHASLNVPACKNKVATIAYELNVLRTRGPRRLNCILNSIPISAIQEGGSAPTPTSFPQFSSQSEVLRGKDPIRESTSPSLPAPSGSSQDSVEPLVLKNKAPRWHEQLQCWCLNFKGRVTVASVKNFQLVAAIDPSQNVSAAEHEKVILQFGKIGKDIFTMDYRYPLSAFQAFAICLSSFDTKPACEWLQSCWRLWYYDSHSSSKHSNNMQLTNLILCSL